jgi:hypothetical protein
LRDVCEDAPKIGKHLPTKGGVTVFVCALITGTQEAMAGLVGVGELSLVPATAREETDGQWSVVAYAPTDTLDALAAQDYQVSILSDEAALQQRWDAVQDQVEE